MFLFWAFRACIDVLSAFCQTAVIVVVLLDEGCRGSSRRSGARSRGGIPEVYRRTPTGLLSSQTGGIYKQRRKGDRT